MFVQCSLPGRSNISSTTCILFQVPSSALSSLDGTLLVLTLDYQRITTLAVESLPLTNLLELSMRAVHDGAVVQRLVIDDFAFAKLSSLTKLDLSHNKVPAAEGDFCLLEMPPRC